MDEDFVEQADPGASERRPRPPRERALAALARLKPARTPRPLSAAPSWSWSELAGRLCELSGVRGGALSLAARLVHDAQRRGETVAWVLSKSSSFFPPDVEAGGVDLASLAVVRTAQASANARAADFLMRSGAFGLVVIELDEPGRAPVDVPLALQSRLLAAAQAHDAVVLCLSDKPRGASSLGSLVSFHGEVELARANVSDSDGGSNGGACRGSGGEMKEGTNESANEGSSESTNGGSSEKTSKGSSEGPSRNTNERASWESRGAPSGRFTCTLVVRKDKRRSPGWRHVEVCRGPLGLR